MFSKLYCTLGLCFALLSSSAISQSIQSPFTFSPVTSNVQDLKIEVDRSTLTSVLSADNKPMNGAVFKVTLVAQNAVSYDGVIANCTKQNLVVIRSKGIDRNGKSIHDSKVPFAVQVSTLDSTQGIMYKFLCEQSLPVTEPGKGPYPKITERYTAFWQ